MVTLFSTDRPVGRRLVVLHAGLRRQYRPWLLQEGGMEDNTIKHEKKADPQIEDLPSRITPEAAEKIKGGARRPDGDNDDQEELDVER